MSLHAYLYLYGDSLHARFDLAAVETELLCVAYTATIEPDITANREPSGDNAT